MIDDDDNDDDDNLKKVDEVYGEDADDDDYDDDDDDDDEDNLEKVDEVDGEDGTHPIVRESFARLHPNDEEDPPAENINTASEENVAYLGYGTGLSWLLPFLACSSRSSSVAGFKKRL